MVRDSVPIEHQMSRSTFRATSGNLDVVGRILEAWFASEPHIVQQAYVGEDGSGVTVKSSLGGGVHRVDRGAVQVEWSVTEEQREHLGYPVLVAVGEVLGEEVEAWFAPAIPVSGGPAFFGGLPGMILVLSLNGGLTTYAATEDFAGRRGGGTDPHAGGRRGDVCLKSTGRSSPRTSGITRRAFAAWSTRTAT